MKKNFKKSVLMLSLLLTVFAASAINPLPITKSPSSPPPPDTVTVTVDLGSNICESFGNCPTWTAYIYEYVNGTYIYTNRSLSYNQQYPFVIPNILMDPTATGICVWWIHSGTPCVPPLNNKLCCTKYVHGQTSYTIPCNPCN